MSRGAQGGSLRTTAINGDKKANRRRVKRETMRLLYSVVTNFTVNKVPRSGAGGNMK